MRYVFIILAACLAACSKPDTAHLQLYSDNSELTALSLDTRRFGITSLRRVAYSNDVAAYAFSGGVFTYRQVNDHTIQLTLEKDGQTTVVTSDRKAQKMTYQDRDAETAPLSLDEQTRLALSLTLFNEVANPNLERSNASLAREEYATCNYTAISIYYSKSGSVEKLNAFVNDYLQDHSNCQRRYGVDSGCVWGDYGCISTQEISCNC